ncbi:hypothetical protein Lser_V15G07480 [Lactuca serriola]
MNDYFDAEQKALRTVSPSLFRRRTLPAARLLSLAIPQWNLHNFLFFYYSQINLMEPSSEEEYETFIEKVERTIYLDNISNQVTEAVLKTALDQFATVKNVQFIPTYFNSCTIYAALVEMETAKQAQEIVKEISDSPFMISGMPRPVRAQKAKIEMFDDRPKMRREKIVCYWMDPSHPNFDVAKKLKNLTKKHAVEASFLMEKQMEEEEKLHNQQEVSLKANFKKYELIDSAQGDGTFRRLGARYGSNYNDF